MTKKYSVLYIIYDTSETPLARLPRFPLSDGQFIGDVAVGGSYALVVIKQYGSGRMQVTQEQGDFLCSHPVVHFWFGWHEE